MKKKIFTIALTIVLCAMPCAAWAQGSVIVVNRTNGATLEYESADVESITFGTTPWISQGYCLYGEDFIASDMYPTGGSSGDYCCQYYVEVQENIDEPGLYRLVNPYAPATYPFASSLCDSYDTSVDTYIEIDARDPEGVIISWQKTGVLNNEYGEISVYSYAAYMMDYSGYTLSQAKAQGWCGTLADGVITFPTGMLLTAFSIGSYYGSYFYANNYDNFLLDLNDTSSAPGPKGVKALSAERSAAATTAVAESNRMTTK